MTREEEAQQALLQTQFAPGAALTLTGVLLAVIFTVPLLQCIVDVRQPDKKTAAVFSTPQEQQRDAPSGESNDPLASPAPDRRSPGVRGFLRTVVSSAGRMRSYARRVAQNSVVTENILPPAQLVLTSALGMGNQQVILGRDGWFFYTEDVKYLAHGPFLADPTRANAIIDQITSAQRQLAQRGIKLILLPIPPKPVIYPEKLSSRFDGSQPLQNPSYDPLLKQLRAQGVTVFDVTPVLREAKKQSAKPLYMLMDTHWSPAGMSHVAQALAQFIKDSRLLPPGTPLQLTRHSTTIQRTGDLIDVLRLPQNQSQFLEQVTVEQIQTADGALLRPRQDADVLLVGDSLAAVFGGGDSKNNKAAGLVEHLAAKLERPVDCILHPLTLSPMEHAARVLAADPKRLNNKRLVIWEFNARWLAVGRWGKIDLSLAPGANSTQPLIATR
ncbi:MAG: hypothetical protein M3347_15190 [Armatimonadota bacterium]|nr:hypothetical protein [Armatimonadota bacterium]